MKSQAEKRKNDLSNRVAAIPVGDQIQIRSTTGIYRVTVLGHRPEIAAVEIAFGDGTRALCKHGAIVWPEEAAKWQAEQANTIVQSGQPRQHPMQRSKSGQNLAAATPQTVQAGHPYPMTHIQQSQTHQIYQPQQLQQAQQQYHSQGPYQASPQAHAFPVPPQQHAQYHVPQVQAHYSQQFILHQQQQQYQTVPYYNTASPLQHSPPVQHSPPFQPVPAQVPQAQPFGFVPQPIPYYNGKPVEIKTKPRLPQTLPQ